MSIKSSETFFKLIKTMIYKYIPNIIKDLTDSNNEINMLYADI